MAHHLWLDKVLDLSVITKHVKGTPFFVQLDFVRDIIQRVVDDRVRCGQRVSSRCYSSHPVTVVHSTFFVGGLTLLPPRCIYSRLTGLISSSTPSPDLGTGKGQVLKVQQNVKFLAHCCRRFQLQPPTTPSKPELQNSHKMSNVTV